MGGQERTIFQSDAVRVAANGDLSTLHADDEDVGWHVAGQLAEELARREAWHRYCAGAATDAQCDALGAWPLRVEVLEVGEPSGEYEVRWINHHAEVYVKQAPDDDEGVFNSFEVRVTAWQATRPGGEP